MKKKRGKRVEAYTDETGHSGLNLFDAGQPWFWTGTLVSPVAVQGRGGPALAGICAALGVSSIHAREIGIARIESVASAIQGLLESIEAKFVFTAIEKHHLAAGKLAETVLDSTMNQAVSGFHYGVHGMRILLSDAIVTLVNQQDQEEFWTAYNNGGSSGLSAVLSRLLVRLHSDGRFDRKLKELLSDVLRWGVRHSLQLLEFRRSELDAPNLVAFGLLMNGLHEALEGSGYKVGRFVHDQQQQFGRFFLEWYRVGSRFSLPTHLTARITDIKPIATYDCKIEILPSRSVVGLQLVDVVLWLYKRAVNESLVGYPKCAELVQFVDDRSEVRQHSREQLSTDAERVHRDILRLPVTPEQLDKGRQISEELEQARRRRMLE